MALRIAATVATSVGLTGGALALSSWAPASAAPESHGNCLQFDQDGNPVWDTLVPNCTDTETSQGGAAQSQDGANPCTGDSGTVSMLPGRSVYHINVDGDGDLWVTGTDTGTMTFTPDVSTASIGTGTYTDWFNFNLNDRDQNSTDTFDVEVHFPNGQLVTQHEVSHFGLSATGIVVNFDKGGDGPTCVHV